MPATRCGYDSSSRIKVPRLARTAALDLAGITHCVAADLPADLHIERVTVYPQGAVVTRAGQVAIPAGAHRLIVSGLPASIDAKTLRVNVGGGTAQLGGVELADINEGRFVSDAERALQGRLEATEDRRVVLQDDVSTAQTQLKLLDSIASNPVGNATRPSLDAANLAGVLTTMATRADAARQRLREDRVKLRSLDRELEQRETE